MRDVRGRDERINRQRRAWDGRANGKWTNTRDAICKAIRRLAHILRIYIYIFEKIATYDHHRFQIRERFILFKIRIHLRIKISLFLNITSNYLQIITFKRDSFSKIILLLNELAYPKRTVYIIDCMPSGKN